MLQGQTLEAFNVAIGLRIYMEGDVWVTTRLEGIEGCDVAPPVRRYRVGRSRDDVTADVRPAPTLL